MLDSLYSHIQTHSPVNTHFHLQESAALYLTHTIRGFALSMIGIFIPIFIFRIDNKPAILSDPILNSLFIIISYYLAKSMTIAFSTASLTNFIFEKINFRRSIFISTLLLSVFFLSLSLAQSSIIFLYIGAFLSGAQTILYWIPYHLLFIRKAGHHGHFGKSFGTRVFLIKIVKTAGPVIGGTLIALYGFNLLFIFSIMILLVSSLPILVSVEDGEHNKHSAKKILFKYLKNPKYRNDTIAFSAEQTEAQLLTIFWPIVLFIALNSFTKLGAITSIAVLASSAAFLIVGGIIDKHGVKKIHKIGITVNSLLHIPKAIATSQMPLYAVKIIDDLNGSLYGIPYNSAIYEHAQKYKHDSDYIIYREVVKQYAGSISLILVMGILPLLPDWRYIFYIIAVIAPFTYFINRNP